MNANGPPYRDMETMKFLSFDHFLVKLLGLLVGKSFYSNLFPLFMFSEFPSNHNSDIFILNKIPSLQQAITELSKRFFSSGIEF